VKLIGREGERRRVHADLAAGRSVCVAGDAGIGKTTLLRELAEATGARYGGAFAMLASMPYLPVAQALGETPPAGDHASVADWVAARLAGAVLVLDDLQWADHDTLIMLDRLSGHAAVLAAVRLGDRGARSVLDRLAELDFETVRLRPLRRPDAERLLRARRPRLGRDEVANVLAAARGNPFLLEELPGSGDLGSGVQLGLAAIARRLSRAEHASAVRLALLARPVRRELAGPGAERLLRTGLAVELGGRIQLRHALIAEAVLDELEPAARAAAHAELARIVEDPAEAAAHHDAAGEREPALARAMEAAEGARRGAERGRLLALAARNASGDTASRLSISAARQLVDEGDHASAAAVVADLRCADPVLRAEAALERGRAAWNLGEHTAARRHFERGLAEVEGRPHAVAVRLQFELARAHAFAWEAPPALSHAQAAWGMAERLGAQRAAALLAIANARMVALDVEDAIDAGRRALAAAAGEGDSRLRFEALGFLAAAYAAGRPRSSEGVELLAQMAREAAASGMRGEEALMQSAGAVLKCNRGEPCDAVLADCEAALARPGLGSNHDGSTVETWVLTLADMARFSDGRTVAHTWLERPASPVLRGRLLGAMAELEWLADRPRHAQALADQALRVPAPYVLVSRADIVRHRAAFETGGPPPELRAESVDEAATLEILALHDATSGSIRSAQERFAAAADLHLEARCAWRCRWSAAEVALAGGDRAGARRGLLDVEVWADAHGHAVLATRARRSLRRAGVRRSPSAGRGVRDALTPREREVLTLVRTGLRSTDIATRLGIAVATVDSHVASARRKLGARSRAQAAALLDAPRS
jgi:DNA-binding CsgD family transcriptional regulator